VATRYGSAANVKTRTGIQFGDLGLADDAALTVFIEGVLDEVTDLMDRKMHKTYLTGTVPKGVDGIANDAASDSLRVMVATRQTPVVRIDDFAIRAIQTNVFSADILARLKVYSAGGGVGTYEVTQSDLADLPQSMSLAGFDLWVQENE
jgi:hypothetical protein